MATMRVYQVAFQFGATIGSGVIRAFTQTQQNINGLNRGLVNSQRQATLTNRAMSSLGGNLKTIAGIAGSYFGLRAVTGFFRDSLNTFQEFEASMSEVKAISGATGSDFEALSQKAEELGKSTSKTASESAQAMKYQALAGWDVKTILESTEPILRLSEAGNLDLARSSDIVTDSMSALGLSSKQLPEYLDKMSQTSRKSNTDIDALGEAFIVAGGTFKNLNVPLYESSAILGILANRGKKGSEAGNALNSIMVNLTTGAGQAGKAMKELKISAFDGQGEFKGMANVLKEVRNKTKDMTDEQRNSYLAMIGGKTQLDILQALLAGVGDEFDNLQKDIKNSNGALNELAKEMQDNLKGAFTRLGSAIEGFQIDFSENIGKKLTPVIDRFSNRIVTAGPDIIVAFENIQGFISSKVIPIFRDIGAIAGEIGDKFFPNMTLSMADAGSTIKGDVIAGLNIMKGTLLFVRDNSNLVKAAVIGLTYAYTTHKAIILATTIAQNAANIATKISAGYHLLNRARVIASTTATIAGSNAVGLITGAQWLWNAALTANPIGTVVVAVGILAAGIFALYKNFDKVIGAVKSAWGWLKKFTGLDTEKKISEVNELQNEKKYLRESRRTIQTSNSVPGFAKGVSNFAGGVAVVGEEGPELVHLSRGSNVTPNNKTESILNSFHSSGSKSNLKREDQSIQVTYSPQIVIQGNADENTIRNATDESFTSFKKKYENLIGQNNRLSFSR